MSYEFNAESKKLDVPNPYRVENYFLFISAGILILGGITLLLQGRNGIGAAASVWTLAPILLGIVLLVFGIQHAARAANQLRFYFGRGKPAGLAPELSMEQLGDSDGARNIKETLRQNAIHIDEPTGSLNGVLYSLIPDLIFAPKPIQIVAQRQFQTALAILVTFISFLISWFGFANSAASAWMGMFFFLFAATLLIKPLEHGTGTKVNLGMKGLIGLVLAAVFGPVIVPLFATHLPDISWLSTNLQTLLMLIAGMAATGLFFVALTKQSFAPPNTSMACEQDALSMNSAPKQLMDELDRLLQSRWIERIPNRRYTKLDPNTSSASGSFFSELLEESQPMPREDLRHLDLATCFSERRYKWLGWLNVLGIAMVFFAVVSFVTFGVLAESARPDAGIAHFVTLGIAMLLVGSFCIKAGHFLWGRFDFVSEVIWIEMKGNYQSAKLDYGNNLTDKIKTQKQLINIESMTLRVWVAQLDTVTFGKDSQRLLIGLRGVPNNARYFKDHLVQFAKDQSIMIAPTSAVDMQKAAALGAINQMSGAPHHDQTLLQSIVAATSNTQTCGACQAVIEQADLFCMQCGCKLTAEQRS